MKYLFSIIILVFAFSASSQITKSFTHTLDGGANDTTTLSIVFSYQGNGVVTFDASDLDVGEGPMYLQAEGSIDGVDWYSLYLAPASTGIPSIAETVSIESEDAIFLPSDGFTTANLQRPFRYLRFISENAGGFNGDVLYRFMYKSIR